MTLAEKVKRRLAEPETKDASKRRNATALPTNIVRIAATSPGNVDRSANLAEGHGGAYPAVKSNKISDTEVAFPCDTILSAFDEPVLPLRGKIEQAKDEFRTLAETCDLLLPKLMSGELRLPDVEQFIEEID